MEPESQGTREGRVRSGWGPLLAVAMLVILAGVWLFGGRLAGEGSDAPPPTPEPTAPPTPEPTVSTGPTAPPTGRLVYPAFEATGPKDRPQRLWVLDVTTGAVTPGPRVPTAEELVAVGPDRSWVLVITDLGSQGGAAYVLRDLSTDAVPVEVARGDLLSVSNRADGVVAARTDPVSGGRCPRSRYVIGRVPLARGVEHVVARGTIVCGRLLSVTAASDQVYVSTIRDGVPETAAASGGRLAAFFPGSLLHSAGPDGSWLTIDGGAGTVRSLRVWPRTPTGTLAWSRGPSSRRPLVQDDRLFAERVVAWSSDGRAVVVSGIVGGERSLWLVDVAEGSMTRLLPAGSVPLRSAFSGASFDAEGNVFVGASGEILVGTADGLTPLVLAPDAPSPAGPVAWLP